MPLSTTGARIDRPPSKEAAEQKASAAASWAMGSPIAASVIACQVSQEQHTHLPFTTSHRFALLRWYADHMIRFVFISPRATEVYQS